MRQDGLYRKLLNSKRWRELRVKKLNNNPLCESCLRKGITRAASCVHHITPVESAKSDADAVALCYSYSNLQSLCRECHNEIHIAERYNSKAKHKERELDRQSKWRIRFKV